MRFLVVFCTLVLCQIPCAIHGYAQTLKNQAKPKVNSEIIVSPGANFITDTGNEALECTLGFLGYSHGRKIALTDAACNYKTAKKCSIAHPQLTCNLAYTPAGTPIGSFEHARHDGVDTIGYIVLRPEIKINPLINEHKIREHISLQDSSIKNFCVFTRVIMEKCGYIIQTPQKNSQTELISLPGPVSHMNHIYGAPVFALTPQGLRAVAVVTEVYYDTHHHPNGNIQIEALSSFLSRWNITLA